MSIRGWLQRASVHLEQVKASGPQFGAKAVPGAAQGYNWHGTINGRVATSIGVASEGAAVEAAKAIYAKNVRPGLPDPYSDPTWLAGPR